MAGHATPVKVERAARALLDAMDRQYGNPPFSQNVQAARHVLRDLLPAKRDKADESRAA